uniref:Cystatin n=1 Tax=Haemaphysalis flava TaxID=181088 RepID=A0A160DA52_HAEFA|nr:cystatin [Haemaphysalis flava]
MKAAAAFCFLAVVGVALCSKQKVLLGGWTQQDPSSNAKYLHLAHFAISQQTNGLNVYHTVLKLVKVETQVVAGINYKVTFETAPTNCPISEEYSSEKCKPTTDTPAATCIAIVYERPWENYRELTSFTCPR